MMSTTKFSNKRFVNPFNMVIVPGLRHIGILEECGLHCHINECQSAVEDGANFKFIDPDFDDEEH